MVPYRVIVVVVGVLLVLILAFRPSGTLLEATGTGSSGLSKDSGPDPCGQWDTSEEPTPVTGPLVLVTGGSGFIGSNLIDLLLRLGYRVRVLDNLSTGNIRNLQLDRVEFVHGDITDKDTCKKVMRGVQGVFHLAAMSKVVPSMKSPAMARFCHENNVLGTMNVLEAAKAAGVTKVVYAASSTFYGSQPIPHHEGLLPDFLTPYAATKYEGEIYMHLYDRVYHLPTVCLRFFMVYGPRQPQEGAYAIVTGIFLQRQRQGLELLIEGAGDHFRDFVHVSDVARALTLAYQNTAVRNITLNVGTGQVYTVQEVADMVGPKDRQRHIGGRTFDLVGTRADTCTAKRLLGFTARKSFDVEMRRQVRAVLSGEVFPLPAWLQGRRVDDAPWILPADDPRPAYHKVDALRSLIPIVSKGLKEIVLLVYRVSITPKYLLQNTVASLRSTGEVAGYAVITLDHESLLSCRSLHLPCINTTNYPDPGAEHRVAVEVLKMQVGVFVTRADTVFHRPLWPSLHHRVQTMAVEALIVADAEASQPPGWYYWPAGPTSVKRFGGLVDIHPVPGSQDWWSVLKDAVGRVPDPLWGIACRIAPAREVQLCHLDAIVIRAFCWEDGRRVPLSLDQLSLWYVTKCYAEDSCERVPVNWAGYLLPIGCSNTPQ